MELIILTHAIKSYQLDLFGILFESFLNKKSLIFLFLQPFFFLLTAILPLLFFPEHLFLFCHFHLLLWFFGRLFFLFTFPFLFGGVFVEFEFVSLLKLFADGKAHEVMSDLNADGPLRVVDVREVAVFFSKKFNLFEDFFVLKLAVVSAAKVKHPAFYFPRESMA